ncbi:MAG: hypothetical protein K2Y71_11705 [Xanthobacteraceae bacterium]|nr:hypothetical protein [Xanthobacteraceae bacterium]
MTATAALPKPRGPWRAILLSGVLAVAMTLVLQPLFVLALIAVRSHTDLDAVRGHIRAAFDQGVLAENHVPGRFIHRGGHQFTECIGHVVLLDRQQDAARTAIFPLVHDQYRLRNPCEQLKTVAGGTAPAAVTDYARYWHGYRVYLWPLLERFDLASVRLINALLILAAVFACYAGFRATIGATPAAVFIVVLLSLTDLWLAWRISTHAVSLAFILLGVGAFGLIHARWRNPYLAVAMATFCGATFNFVDFLVNPPLMPMLLAFVVLAAQAPAQGGQAPPAAVGAGWLAALVAVSWLGAYSFTWAVKWGLAAWVSPAPAETFGETLAQIVARLHGHEIDHPPILSLPLYPTVRMFGKALLSFGTVVAIVLAIAVRRHVRDVGFDRRRFLVLISPALIPIIWFEVVSNHTQTHMHFTYRSASAAIALAFAAALIASAKPATLPQLMAGLRRLRRYDQ